MRGSPKPQNEDAKEKQQRRQKKGQCENTQFISAAENWSRILLSRPTFGGRPQLLSSISATRSQLLGRFSAASVQKRAQFGLVPRSRARRCSRGRAGRPDRSGCSACRGYCGYPSRPTDGTRGRSRAGLLLLRRGRGPRRPLGRFGLGLRRPRRGPAVLARFLLLAFPLRGFDADPASSSDACCCSSDFAFAFLAGRVALGAAPPRFVAGFIPAVFNGFVVVGFRFVGVPFASVDGSAASPSPPPCPSSSPPPLQILRTFDLSFLFRFFAFTPSFSNLSSNCSNTLGGCVSPSSPISVVGFCEILRELLPPSFPSLSLFCAL